MDEYAGCGKVDFDAIKSLKMSYQGKFAKVYEVEDLKGFIDRETGKAIIGR